MGEKVSKTRQAVLVSVTLFVACIKALFASYLARVRLPAPFECRGVLMLVLVCVGTQCVPSVATRVVAKIYRPIFL